MSSSFIMFKTEGHRGLVRLSIEFLTRGEGSLTTYIHKHRSPCEENHLWKFQNTLKMNLKPIIAFDKNLLSKKQLAQGYDQ